MGFDVVALGELLIDFTLNDYSPQGNGLFEACPGGAPCNVLAMLKKLGKDCAFVGKVGDDMFGRLLCDCISEVGIDTGGLVMDSQISTTLAFVKTFENGERDFSFYRNPGADMMLSVSELPINIIKDTKIFHFGTLSMTHEGVCKATKVAVKAAKESGAIISFDPNIRQPLWKSIDDAKHAVSWGLSQCDILKIADNEIEIMTGESDYGKGAAILQNRYPNIKVLNVTAGPQGSYSFYGDEKPVFVDAVKLGGTVETTGAGDTFCACVISFILDHGLKDLTVLDRKKMLEFANAAAYLVTTKKGAIRSMPDIEDIVKIQEKNEK